MIDMIFKDNEQLEGFIFDNFAKLFKLGFIIYVIFFTGYILTDLMILPDEWKFFIAHRFFIALPFLLFPVIINKTEYYRKHFNLINLISLLIPSILSVNMFLLVKSHDIDIAYYYFAGLIIQTFTMGLMLIRLRTTIISIAIMQIYYLLSIFFLNPDVLNVLEKIISYTLLLSAGTATSMLTRFYIEMGNKLSNLQADLTESLKMSDMKLEEIADLNSMLVQNRVELQLLLNYINAPAILVDTDGRILELNDERAKLFGLSRPEVLDRYLSDFLDEENFQKRVEILKILKETRNTFKYEREEKGKVFEVTVNPIFDRKGEIYKIAALYYDITFRKEYEEKLIDINVTKDKFFSIISHDLRNPIGSLKKLIEFFIEDIDNMSKEERDEILKILKESSTNLFDLLENLLVWARSQQGKISFNVDDVRLFDIVKNVQGSLNLHAIQKKIKILNNVQSETIIKADANLISTVIRNLISNSIKFTNIYGIITINYSDRGDDHLICVEDNGVGMDEKTKSKLFTLNKNSSNLGTANERGTGLGLLLCHEFVKLHNGNIWVESELGVGSKFYITIPKLIKKEVGIDSLN